MKKLLIAATLCAAAVPALAQIDVNINIGDPGFYGRITNPDLRPRVYVTQPVIVERAVQYRGDPVYLRVPPGHRKNWRKHCYKYDACGQRVLFVRDDWYTNSYAPRVRQTVVYREAHSSRSERRDDRRDNDHGRDHDKGHGKDKHHGKGHGKDKH
jgi:hypothetical protein